MPNPDTLLSLLLFQVAASALYFLFSRWMQKPGWNRFILLAIYLLPFAVMRLPLPGAPSPVSEMLVTVSLPEIRVGNGLTSSGSRWYLFYFLPACFILGRTLWGIILMIRYRLEGKVAEQGRLRIIRHGKVQSPFSFFFWIFLPEQNSGELEKWVLRHEQVHAFQVHSIDVLIARVVRALCWINPFLYFLERQMALNHEYLADRGCLRKEKEKEHYAEALLSVAMGSNSHLGGQAFSLHSQLKNRLHMIHRLSTPKKGGYFFLLPLLLLSLTWAACQQNQPANEIPGKTEIEEKKALKPNEVDTGPEMEGGGEALFGFLSAELKYPKHLEAEKKEARVMVQFTVSETGAVEKVEVLNKGASDEAFEQEALRAVRAMPAWTPGMKDGKPVPVSMVLPIAFKLD